jgi:hypothetical protein
VAEFWNPTGVADDLAELQHGDDHAWAAAAMGTRLRARVITGE